MEKKKDCPCCGSKEVFPAYHFAERYVYCEYCGLRTKTYKTLQLAIKAWNTRSLNNDLIEALKEITKGEGRYDINRLKHAENTIEDMKSIAVKVLKLIQNVGE